MIGAIIALVTRGASWWLIGVVIAWTLFWVMAACWKCLDLSGWFFQRNAARLYRSLAVFLSKGKASISKWTMEPVNYDAELSRQKNLYSRFYHPLDDLAHEASKRRKLPPPPPREQLLWPDSIEQMQVNAEWVWSLRKHRAYLD